jgi:antitoxin VapB
MSLNIKNEETHKLAKELAALTGQTMTLAVNQAIREKLERLRKQKEMSMAQRLVEIGKDCAHRLKESSKSTEHGNMLYE